MVVANRFCDPIESKWKGKDLCALQLHNNMRNLFHLYMATFGCLMIAKILLPNLYTTDIFSLIRHNLIYEKILKSIFFLNLNVFFTSIYGRINT